MRKQEQRLWDRMRRALATDLYLERVENVVSAGRPDVDVMWGGVTMPVELKTVAVWPRRASTPVLSHAKLNRNQINWWLRWRRWGGVGRILVGVGGELFAVPGEFSDHINSFTRARLLPYRVTWADFILLVKQEAQCLLRR